MHLSSVNPYYLAGVLDNCLSLSIKNQHKLVGRIMGHRSLLSFIQGLLDGRVSRTKHPVLTLSTSQVESLASYLSNIPSLLQSTYQSILRLKAVKLAYDPLKPNLAAYHTALECEALLFRQAYQARHAQIPTLSGDDLISYRAGYIESSKWLTPRLGRNDLFTPALIVRGRESRWSWLGIQSVSGNRVVPFLNRYTLYMLFRREIFDKVASLSLRAETESGIILLEEWRASERSHEESRSLTLSRTVDELAQSAKAMRAKKAQDRQAAQQMAKTAKTLRIQSRTAAIALRRQQKQTSKETRFRLRAEKRQVKRLEREADKAAKREAELTLVASGRNLCLKCRETLPLDQFCKSASRSTGYSLYCKPCCKRDHYLPNRAINIARTKAWLKAHPAAKRRHAKKEKSKPHNRIKSIFKKRISDYLKSASTSYRQIISCTPKQLVAHLEGQFSPDMTWANYGILWHIDHIIPCAAFDPTKASHLKWCWHHRNLRPLLAVENVIKGDILPTGENASTLRETNPTRLRQIVASELERLNIATISEVDASYHEDRALVYVDLR